jgi:NitT/TauT family transport system substrate-binding protein
MSGAQRTRMAAAAPRTPRRARWLAGALGAAVLLAGGAGAQAQVTKVKIAEVVRAHLFVPMYVALAKGFVKEEGLEVELITAQTGDRVGALMLGGQVDFGLSGTQTPIYMHNSESRDKPLIFCALAGTDGLYLSSRRKIDRFEWSMLNGKKILGWQPGSSPQLSLEFLMKARGVEPATIRQVITNISPQAREGAWISGLGDFVIFIEPTTTKLERAGQLHAVASMGKELGRADYSLFFATRSWLEKNKPTAQKWTNAIARAQAWMKTASARDIAEAVTDYFPGISLEENIAVVDRFRASGAPIWSETTEVDRAGLAKFQGVMVAGGTLPTDKVLPYDTIVTEEFSRQAQQRLAPK